jgi:hypothetical protein
MFRPAYTLTRPPALPVGVNTVDAIGPASTVPISPRSTPQPAPTGCPLSVALYMIVGVCSPMPTAISCSSSGCTSNPIGGSPLLLSPLLTSPLLTSPLLRRRCCCRS